MNPLPLPNWLIAIIVLALTVITSGVAWLLERADERRLSREQKMDRIDTLLSQLQKQRELNDDQRARDRILHDLEKQRAKRARLA